MEKLVEAITQYRKAQAEVVKLDGEHKTATATAVKLRAHLSAASDHRDMLRKAVLELMDSEEL